ncbi:MAG: cbb3-type cytochrome c oxidase subunit II [Verrucomicrobiota bacterium]|nr:cbb3-type cytochrome c oxidase subunit II [Verrucomicrobiota bacterium]
MNRTPEILAGILVALLLSWYAMVWTPASQQKDLLPYVDGETVYPRDRAGLAKQGAEIYRANGCYHCHSQQVRQGEVEYHLLLTRTGNNQEALIGALKDNDLMFADSNGTEKEVDEAKIELSLFLNSDDLNATTTSPDTPEIQIARELLGQLKDEESREDVYSLASLAQEKDKAIARKFLGLPQTMEGEKSQRARIELAGSLTWDEAKSKLQALKDANASAMLEPRKANPDNVQTALWSDVDKGWGLRRSVARDYLFDMPAMLGDQRIGPDLADIGGRRTDAAWHYRHLYKPREIHEKSVMPPYAFLFNKRTLKKGEALGADAVTDNNGKSIEPGYEVTPKPSAHALVAYLLSLSQPDVVPEAPAPKQMATRPEKKTK